MTDGCMVISYTQKLIGVDGIIFLAAVGPDNNLKYKAGHTTAIFNSKSDPNFSKSDQ